MGSLRFACLTSRTGRGGGAELVAQSSEGVGVCAPWKLRAEDDPAAALLAELRHGRGVRPVGGPGPRLEARSA